MTDEEFREAYKPMHVPAAYADAHTLTEKVVFALADLGEGSAEAIIGHLEKLEPQAQAKPLIAGVREILADLYENGRIAATEKEGTLIYNLHKITKANDGAVDPDLLAPGLD